MQTTARGLCSRAERLHCTHSLFYFVSQTNTEETQSVFEVSVRAIGNFISPASFSTFHLLSQSYFS